MKVIFYAVLLIVLSASTSAFAIVCTDDCGPPMAYYKITALLVFPVSIALALLMSRKQGMLGTRHFQKCLTYFLLVPPIIIGLADLWMRYMQAESLRDDGSPLILFWITTSLLLVALHGLFLKVTKSAPTRSQKIYAVWVLGVLLLLFYATR